MKRKTISPIHFMYEHPRDQLPETISLETNFSLEKFDKKLVLKVTDHFTDFYSRHDIQELENCRFSAVYDYEVSDVNAADEGQIKVHRLIESLRVVRPTRASCSTFVFDVDSQGILIPKAVSGRSSNVFLVDNKVGESHFTTLDEAKIKKYYLAVDNLYTNNKGRYNRILNAFIFFQLGYLTHYAKLRIVPFVTALESFFNTCGQEIGYSLRMRCAAFLGNNKSEKESLIKRIKLIYNLRSAVTHGASLPKYMVKDPKLANITLRDAEDICRLCLQKIFDHNLTNQFLESNDKLSQYFDNLVIS